MLTSLVLAAVVASGPIKVDHYQIPLTGPVLERTAVKGFVIGSKPPQAPKLRLIDVYVAADRMLCDTAGAVSVIKSEGEYIFLDHKRKEALVFPLDRQDKGKRAVCATTPFWPEAYGDATSLDELKLRAAYKPPEVNIDEPGPISYSPPPRRVGLETIFLTDYSVIPNSDMVIHNTWFNVRCESTMLSVIWLAQNHYGPSYEQPDKMELDQKKFQVPSGYRLFLASPTKKYQNATVLEANAVDAFVDRFLIPNAFPWLP